jgi:Rad3-related DNA helicase
MITQDQRDKYQEELDKITYLLDDYQTNHEKWAITTYLNRKGQPRTKFEPVTTSRFIEPLIENKIVVLMSATLPKEGQEAVIEVDSPFPVEIRPWIYKPLGRMSRKYRDNTIPKVALFLSKLEGKTLVHCVSYATAEKLQLALLALGKHPLLQTNGDDEIIDEDMVKRWDAVRGFKTAQDPNKILLSVKLDRGVDFSEPEIVNNVIACLAFPNPTEPLTKAKNEMMGESWQIPYIIADIEQKYGRIHRNEKLGIVNGKEVTKKTYIVDGNFGWFYGEHKSKFHKWFTGAQVKS